MYNWFNWLCYISPHVTALPRFLCAYAKELMSRKVTVPPSARPSVMSPSPFFVCSDWLGGFMRLVLHYITVNAPRVNELACSITQAIHSHSSNQQPLLNQLWGRLEVDKWLSNSDTQTFTNANAFYKCFSQMLFISMHVRKTLHRRTNASRTDGRTDGQMDRYCR